MFSLLIGSLFFLLILVYHTNNKDYSSPSFVTILVFLLSTIALSFQKENWGITLSSKTVYVILIFILFFIATEYITAFFVYKENIFVPLKRDVFSIRLPKYLLVFFIGFSMLIAILYYREIRSIAVVSGYSVGKSLIQYARLGLIQGEEKTSFIVSLGTLLVRSIAYICIFIFSYNICIDKGIYKMKNIVYLIPPVIYLIQYTLSGSRGAYIELFSFFLIIFTLFSRKFANVKSLNKKKIFFLGIFTFVLFIIIFIVAGIFKGWEDKSVIDVISLYFGGSIGALNEFLAGTSLKPPGYFGEELFVGINSLLHRIGIYDESFTRILPFVRIGNNGEWTNVYTSIRRYISDFGYIGMIFCTIFVSFVMNFIYSFIKKSKKITYLYFFLGINFMTIVYQSIDEQFFVGLLSVNQLVTLAITYVLYKTFVEKYLRK